MDSYIAHLGSPTAQDQCGLENEALLSDQPTHFKTAGLRQLRSSPDPLGGGYMYTCAACGQPIQQEPFRLYVWAGFLPPGGVIPDVPDIRIMSAAWMATSRRTTTTMT